MISVLKLQYHYICFHCMFGVPLSGTGLRSHRTYNQFIFALISICRKLIEQCWLHYETINIPHYHSFILFAIHQSSFSTCHVSAVLCSRVGPVAFARLFSVRTLLWSSVFRKKMLNELYTFTAVAIVFDSTSATLCVPTMMIKFGYTRQDMLPTATS